MTYVPVVGSRWVDTSGVHAGSTFIVERVTATAVHARQAGRQVRGSHSKNDGSHKIPLDRWSRYEPATERDRRMCLPPTKEKPVTVNDSYLRQGVDLSVLVEKSDPEPQAEVELAPSPYKTCGKCSLAKHRSEFNKNAVKKDGLQLYCRECMNTIKRSYAQAKKVGREMTLGWASQKTAEAGPALAARDWLIKTRVVSYREFTVSAFDFLDAAAAAEQYAEGAEIVGVSLRS